ncbi:Gfo/Idh/MocA family oxidoreductase [Aeromonas bivalvium]|uniref:Gfo/Idh/MocA family oxidoreductase n=1 Tax=Aeromonas bivalvium TaxID=440079 RepID=UPI0038D226BD
MQIGFVGLGAVVETAYLPALRRLALSGLELWGYDRDPARQLAGVHALPSLDALLARPLDLLFITTPSLDHLVTLSAALARAIPLLVVEKPVVARLDQLEQLEALLAEPACAGRVLALDHWMARTGIQQLLSGQLGANWLPEDSALGNPPDLSGARLLRLEGYLQEPSGQDEQGRPIALNFATGEADCRTLRHPDGVILDIGTHVLTQIRELVAALGCDESLQLLAGEVTDRLGAAIVHGDLHVAEGRARLLGSVGGIPLQIRLDKYAGPGGGQKGVTAFLADGGQISLDRCGNGERLTLTQGSYRQGWRQEGALYEHCLAGLLLGEGIGREARIALTRRRLAEVRALLALHQQLRGPH